ncbi:hypothetical protein SUNI508_13428 [Seiridium unicorne]|uniref:Rpr2-domain-containing protein n=1 Tax=Seiridium unicorne TaxID=138068 RepID=A0ABR2VD33_9PEZI
MTAANDTVAAGLNFMTNAAHLLAQASPETSAHLMNQRNTLMFHNNLEQSETHRQHVCGACGHIMIPGDGNLTRLEVKKVLCKKRSRKPVNPPSKPTEPTRHKVLTCGNCGRYTRFSIPAPPNINRNRIKLRQTARVLAKPGQSTASRPVSHAPPILLDPAKAPVSANVNSKKRAKSRKQGLQALLQQSQTQASGPKVGLGLSLTDFMKK